MPRLAVVSFALICAASNFWCAAYAQPPALPAPVIPEDAEATPFKYIGNNFSLKFHKPSCPFAKAMHPSRAELFHFRKDAIAAKYLPCRYCLPPTWTAVNATILHLPDTRHSP